MKKYSIITIALFLCLSMFFHTSAIAIETLVPDTVYWEDKIDESVYESPIYENGKRLIYIERESIPKELIAKNLKQKYNYSMDVYENEEEYEKQIVPAVTARVVAELGETAAYSTAEQLQLTGESISPVDRALSDDYNDYIMAKRAATRELYTASTNSFLEEKVDELEDVLYQGSYTSSIIMYATDAEIERYAKTIDVIAIHPYYDYILDSHAAPQEQTQIAADSDTGTKSSSFNDGVGYQGTGVKIGIIEAKNAKYDPHAPQLQELQDSGHLQYMGSISGTGVESDHATMVTSLIAGHAWPEGGITYEGIVPEATVYQYSTITMADLISAFSQLATLGVSVINFSGGEEIPTSLYQSACDGEIDKLIVSTKITFVCSAGNEGEDSGLVTSPAKGYNVLTVGNAFTKSEAGLPYPNAYTMATSSSYQEDVTIGNKPDVVAPGTNITVPIRTSTGVSLYTSSGTSFSAPLVTGIVAQLHQAKPSLRQDPTATKAIIVAGVDHSVISYDGDYPIEDCEYLLEKSGAGLVNAANSIFIALNNQYMSQSFCINGADNTVTTLFSETDFYAPSNKNTRVAMCFQKDKGSQYFCFANRNFDVDFALYNVYTDELISSSTMLYNHVQIIEFTPTSSDYFYLKAFLTTFETQNSPLTLPVCFAWLHY